MTFLQLVQMFLLYSFLGWCSEVIFAAATYGKFINRGFLNGPVCPIYGYGILMVAILLEPISENMPLLFLGSAVLTSAVEFLVGWGSEKLLHVRLWDYRKQPFNLGGYVCLKFSLLWGLACVFIIRLVHPAVYALVCKIPHVPGVILACVFSAIFVTDLVVTMIEALKLPRRLQAIDDVEKRIRETSDKLGKVLSDKTLAVREREEKTRGELETRYREELETLRSRRKELTERKNLVHDRLIRAFPAIREGDRKPLIEKLRSFEKKDKK